MNFAFVNSFVEIPLEVPAFVLYDLSKLGTRSKSGGMNIYGVGRQRVSGAAKQKMVVYNQV